jgi:hypothetical protein
MAFIKNIDQPTGVTVNYLNISKIEHYCIEKKLMVMINGYISEQARRDGKQPALVQGVEIDLNGKNENENPTREWIYEKLKTNELFSDAEDDI